MTKASTLAVQEREAALKDMNKELRKVCDNIDKELHGLVENNIMSRFRIGKWILAVIGDERKYGEAAVEKLSVALGGSLTPDKIYESRALAQAFTEANLQTLLKKEMANGGRITYTHLTYVADLAPALRKEMLTRIFDEGLSTRELDVVLQQKSGGPRSSGGRKVQLPKTIYAGLHQIGKFSGEIHKRIDIWDQAVFDRLSKASPDDITAETATQLDEAEAVIREMMGDAERLLGQLELGKARVAKVLAGKGESVAPVKKATKKSAKKKTAKKSASTRVANAKAKRTAKKKAAKK